MKNIKEEILEKIISTSDNDLLLLMKQEIDYIAGMEDPLSQLSEADKKELQDQIDRPFGEDAISQTEFEEATKRWRTK